MASIEEKRFSLQACLEYLHSQRSARVGRSKHRARGAVRRADPEDHHFRIPCSVVTGRLKLAMMRVFTLGIVKLQIVALLSSPPVELVVKNLSAHHLALAWSFISPEFMVYTSPLLPSANRDVHD